MGRTSTDQGRPAGAFPAVQWRLQRTKTAYKVSGFLSVLLREKTFDKQCDLSIMNTWFRPTGVQLATPGELYYNKCIRCDYFYILRTSSMFRSNLQVYSYVTSQYFQMCDTSRNILPAIKIRAANLKITYGADEIVHTVPLPHCQIISWVTSGLAER